MKKNYNNYLRLSFLIVMLLVGMNTSFAQLGKTVKVSTNEALTQAIYNPDVQVVSLAEGHYDLLNMDVLSGEEVNIFLEEGERSPDAECIYYINTRATCWIDATTTLLIEAGMIPGDNCATVNSGVWTIPAPGPGTVVYSQPTSIQSQNVTVTLPGVYGLKYTWPNGRYVNGDYLWHDMPVIDVPADYEVCGLTSNFSASFTVAIPAAIQTETWTYLGPGTASVTPGAVTDTWDVTVSACGLYSLTYTVHNGPCVTEETFNINFVTPADIVTPADYEVCGLTSNFIASFDATCDAAIITDTWSYLGPGTATIIVGAVTGTFDISVTVCGLYTITYTVDNGAKSLIDVLR